MDPLTLSALEFDALKRLIEPYLRTPPGRKALTLLGPVADRSVIADRLALAAESMRHHLESGRPGPGAFDDPDPILERLAPLGALLDGIEIARLVAMLRAGASVRTEVSAVREHFPRLWGVASSIPEMRGILAAIEGRISADGRLEDSASPALGKLRRKVLDLEGSLHRSLQTVLDQSDRQGVLQDSYVTVRNGRFVIPVRAESRGSVPGVVHGSSSTGATVFVEPMESLELNNDLVTAREEEVAETRRILSEWSGMLRLRLADIEILRDRMGNLDLLSAVAGFGIRFHCCVAVEGAVLSLVEARHPVLEAGLALRGETCTPLSVELPGSGGALILSGPNAGGKTVALKTLGLLALMNQTGLPVPAKDAILPVWDQISADIGDHQSIQDSLSTFSARMVRVASLSSALAPSALVLLDEVGAGTDPEETAALAVAIVANLRSRGASVVATTHNEPLKAWAEVTPGATNASMEIDEKTLRPTYRVMTGMPGRSGGIDLAERVGLPAGVIADARARLSAGHRETRERLARLQDLAERREREIEDLRAEGEREKSRSENDIATRGREAESLRAAWDAAIASGMETIERGRDTFLSELKDRALALQMKAEARKQSRSLREQIERALQSVVPEGLSQRDRARGASAPAARSGIAPGARVRCPAGPSGVGIVESVDSRGRVTVLLSGKKMVVRESDLVPATDAAPSPKARMLMPEGVKLQRASAQEATSEINLIGSTVEEGRGRLDRFLDDAWLTGLRQVRIVHGFGTGRLRNAVRAMLATHPHVAEYMAAEEKAGGDGATVARLLD